MRQLTELDLTNTVTDKGFCSYVSVIVSGFNIPHLTYEDILFEVYRKSLEDLRERSMLVESTEGYLIKSVKNKCIDETRRLKKHKLILESELLEKDITKVLESNSTLWLEVTRDVLVNPESYLSKVDQIELFNLYYIQHLFVVEIANILGVTENAVKGRLTTLRKNLKESILTVYPHLHSKIAKK